MPTVVIFRDSLLPFSETFIPSQAESLVEFGVVYAGCRRVAGLPLNHAPIVHFADSLAGKAEEIALKSLRWAPRMTAALKRHTPDLIHAHFGTDGAVALPLARSLNIPLLVTFHGFDASLTDQSFREFRWGRRYLRQRDRLKRQAQGFLAVSTFIADKMQAQGFPCEKIRVHYIGVDTKAFNAPLDNQRTKSVLFVGRLVEKKGCEYLIRAMELVQAELPDVELVVIGDGPLRGTLEQMAKKTLRRCEFLGSQPVDVVRDWMNKAMVLCTPSVVASSGDAEGFGIVFIEAQSSGLPVVSFSSGGIPEAVGHGESGYLAPEKDWRQLSVYIAQLLLSADVWKKFSHAGRERVQQMFDLKKQSAKLEDIYRELISAHALGNGQ
jgi:colanic acid/amylovoran biosynthesis glycosyltransferase